MKKLFFLFSTLFLLMFTSCKFQEVTFSGIENVKILKYSREGVEAEITARIKNPNNTSFVIYKSDFDVTLNGINAGKGHLTKNFRVKRKSEESYTFKIKSDFSNVNLMDLPKIMSMAMSKNVKVGLKGNLKAGKIFVKRSFPVDISKNVPMSGN